MLGQHLEMKEEVQEPGLGDGHCDVNTLGFCLCWPCFFSTLLCFFPPVGLILYDSCWAFSMWQGTSCLSRGRATCSQSIYHSQGRTPTRPLTAARQMELCDWPCLDHMTILAPIHGSVTRGRDTRKLPGKIQKQQLSIQEENGVVQLKEKKPRHVDKCHILYLTCLRAQDF